MSQILYEVIEHDGGWAYKVDDVISESFATKDLARAAATRAARAQTAPGETETIEYEDKSDVWHEEVAEGGDRPQTGVKG